MAEPAPASYEISFDLSRIDFRATSDLLKSSYWGDARDDEGHRRAFAHSLCVAAYLDGLQVGFGRAVTDRAYFAYLADIVVWPGHRGSGLGAKMVQALLDHPELASVSHWSLRTRDAQTFYAKFGFVQAADGLYMRLERPDRPVALPRSHP